MTLVKRNNGNINYLFDELFNNFPAHWGKDYNQHFATPATNIYETEDGFHLEMNAAGRNKEDFKIEVDNGLLTIGFEKTEKNSETTAKTIRKEFSYKSFKRSFNLDDKIDTERIAAKYENGILQIFLPKKEENKAGSKQIAIL